MRTSSGERLLAVAVLTCLMIAAWGWVLDLSWTGIDALPLVDASRLASPADAVGLFAQEYRANAGGGAFYRPIASLSYALDYAFWGLEPSAFHGVDLLLHLINALLLVELVSQGLGPRSRAASLVAASLFLVHPALIDTVPAIARRSDMLATTFFLASLVAADRSWRSCGSTGVAWLAVSLLAALLAWGSKEVAFPLPLAVGAMALAHGGGAPRERFRRATRRALPFALLFLFALSARFAVLGGIGGYSWSRVAGPLVLLERMISYSRSVAHDVFDRARVLTHPVAAMNGEGLARELPLCALALSIVAAASWFVWREVRSIGSAGASAEAARADDAEAALAAARTAAFEEALFLTGWLAAVAMLFAASNTYYSWYSYLPAAAAAGLLVSFGRGAMLVLRGSERAGGPSRASAAIVGVFAAASATALLLASPLLRDYPEWRAVSEATELVLEEVERLAPEWQGSDELFLLGIPCHVERAPEYPFRADSAAGLWDYSLEAYMRLRSLAGDDVQLTGLAYAHPSPGNASHYSLRTDVAPRWRFRLDAVPPEILEPPPSRHKSRLPDGRAVWESAGFQEALSQPGAPRLMDVRLTAPPSGRASPKLWLFEPEGSHILVAWDASGELASRIPIE